MNIDLSIIQIDSTKTIPIDGSYNIPKEYYENTDIIDLSDISIKGTFLEKENDDFELSYDSHDKIRLNTSLELELKEKGIDTRLLFTGMHKQKAMRDFGCDCSGEYPVCEWLTQNGFYLPSSSSLSEEIIEYICSVILKFKY